MIGSAGLGEALGGLVGPQQGFRRAQQASTRSGRAQKEVERGFFLDMGGYTTSRKSFQGSTIVWRGAGCWRRQEKEDVGGRS